MDKQKIIEELQKQVQRASFLKFEKDNPTVAAQIKAIKAEDLIIGKRPVHRLAHIEGDVTAVGGNNKDKANASYTQTVATGFRSQAFLYFDGEQYEKLVYEELSNISQYIYPTVIDGPKELGAARMALNTAKELCEKQFHRLNMYLYDTRLNEWSVFYDDEPVESIYAPIFVNLKDKKGRVHKVLIGFFCPETDSGIHVDNIPELIRKQPINSSTSKSVKRNTIIFTVLGIVVVGGILAFILHKFGVF